MRIRDIFAKIDSYGLFMEQWGFLEQLGDAKEADKWQQAAAMTRNEIISDIQGVAGKSDRAYAIYKSFQIGHLTADQAIRQIGALYQ